jgi:hypothetical protein
MAIKFFLQRTAARPLMLVVTVGLPIDLVITDIAMPDVGGQAVVAKLARHHLARPDAGPLPPW